MKQENAEAGEYRFRPPAIDPDEPREVLIVVNDQPVELPTTLPASQPSTQPPSRRRRPVEMPSQNQAK